jgi:hypothetical protein
MDRRRFLSALAGGTAVVAAGRLSWARAPYREAPLVGAAEARAALGGLTPGSRLERWTIVSVLDPSQGGIPVVMATAEGVRFRVDVMRRDQSAPGVANTRAFSLYLCNQGRGSKDTCEEHGLGAMALARHLERVGTPLPSLLTLGERNRRFRGGAFSVLG